MFSLPRELPATQRPVRRRRPRSSHTHRLPPRFDDLEGRLLLTGTTPADPVAAASFLQLPLAFEANSGQTAATVDYITHGAGYTLFLTPGAAVFNLLPGASGTVGAVLRMQVVGGDPNASPVGLDAVPGVSNSFIGDDPANWHTNIANYGRVEYSDVYPGVNLAYYGNQGQIEYDFQVAAGADPSQIVLQYQGADSLTLDAQGNLVASTGGGDVTVRAPSLYQTVNGARQSVSGRFVLLGNDEVGFDVGAYDATLPLVIDPALTYSTFLGGSLGDQAFAVADDSSGNAYVTGETGSNDFPTTTGAYNTLLNLSGTPGNTVTDVFVTKFNTAGQLVYSTFLGGTSDDHGTGIAVDQFGFAYVCGWTSQSTDYPTTPGAFQESYNHRQDGFVTKLSQDGKSLVYSTYLGGTSDDEPHAIAVDGSGNAYVVGDTVSTDFPTKNPIQGGVFNSLDDGFLTKLNANGSALVYSTYIRGSLDDAATGVAVDPQNEAIVVGYTDSTDFPTTPNAFQKTRGGSPSFNVTNTFVTKFNAAGTGYVYSTYLGGSVGVLFDVSNGGAAVATDAAGDAYVAGSTSDSDFPTSADAAQQTFNYTDAFGLGDAYVTKFDPTGGMVYSTFLGGGGLNTSDGATAIAVDPQGYAYITGYTASTSTPFPLAFPIQTTPGQPASFVQPGNYDAFVTRLTPDGSTFDYSSYLGGKTYDYARGIAVDSQGNVTVVGVTRSKASAGGGTASTFPTLNAIKSTPPNVTIGDQDGFASRISLTEPGAGTFYFPSVTYETTEAGSFVTIQVDRRNGDGVAASVNFAMSDGTAKSGTNYLAQSGTLAFPAGVHVATFTIPIVDDHVDDGTPFLVFHLALSGPTAGATLDNSASTADVHVYDVETTRTDNDLYDNAIPVVGVSATVTGNNENATANTGGDDVLDFPVTDGKSTTSPKNAGGASVWWVWAAPASGLTTIDTFGSNFDTLLTVLSYGHVVENDDAPGVSDGTSKITFQAHAGLLYRICVQGYNPGVDPATGNIVLHLNEVSSGSLQLGASAFSVNENGGSVTIPIARVGGSSGAVSVQFSASGGTATSGTDYVAITNQTVSWADGDASTKHVTITILDPHIPTGSKTVNLALASPAGGAALGSPGTAVLTIVDNENPGTVQLSAPTYTVNENGGSIVVSVTRTNGTFGAASVQFSTGGGTATPGVDYTPVTNQTVTWADGDGATKTVTVPILDPHLTSGSKTVNLTLSNASGSGLGSPSTSVLTILDNDSAGTLKLGAAAFSVNETDGSVTISVSRTGGNTGAVSVLFSAGGGTAVPGTDYTAITNQTVSWPDGDASAKNVTITILDPHVPSGSKTVDLTLSSPTGSATLGTPSTAVLTIHDNEALTAPGAPVLASQSDTGVSQTDGITSRNGSAASPLVFTVTGVGPPNGFVQLYDATDAANPVPLGPPVQANGGSATVTLAGGPGLPLPDGVYQFAAASEATSGGTASVLSTTTKVTVQTSVTVATSNPANGSVVSSLPGGQVVINFSHLLAGLVDGGPALGASDPYGIFLLARGPDGAFTAPATSVSAPGYYTGDLPLHATATYRVNGDGTSSVVLAPTLPLSTDVYLVSITLPDFSDLAGNALTDPSGGGYRSFLLQLPAAGGQPLAVTRVTAFNGTVTVQDNAIAQPDTLGIAFNRPLYGASVTGDTVQLLAKSGGSYTVVPSVAAYSPTTATVYLTPTAALQPGTVYLIRVGGKDTAGTPASAYVSDDQGFGGPGFPLGASVYDSFTLTGNSAPAGSGPLTVATSGGAPATLPASNVIWRQPMGYASIGFSEALSLSSIGRYSVMLVPESLPPTVAPLAPNIPLNTSLAFNPNTNQLIVVPTAPSGNNVLYVYSLQQLQGHDGSPLLNNAGQPAGVGGNAAYFQTFELVTGGAAFVGRDQVAGPASAGGSQTVAVASPAAAADGAAARVAVRSNPVAASPRRSMSLGTALTRAGHASPVGPIRLWRASRRGRGVN